MCELKPSQKTNKDENSVWAKAFPEKEKKTKVRTAYELKPSQKTDKGENSVWAKAFPENRQRWEQHMS